MTAVSGVAGAQSQHPVLGMNQLGQLGQIIHLPPPGSGWLPATPSGADDGVARPLSPRPSRQPGAVSVHPPHLRGRPVRVGPLR